MKHDVRKRIVRAAPPDERERHARIRREIEEDLPELKQWARDVAARHGKPKRRS